MKKSKITTKNRYFCQHSIPPLGCPVTAAQHRTAPAHRRMAWWSIGPYHISRLMNEFKSSTYTLTSQLPAGGWRYKWYQARNTCSARSWERLSWTSTSEASTNTDGEDIRTKSSLYRDIHSHYGLRDTVCSRVRLFCFTALYARNSLSRRFFSRCALFSLWYATSTPTSRPRGVDCSTDVRRTHRI